MDDPLSSIRGRMLQDRSSGAAKSLAEYARLFPGEDALVARAYADVFGADASPAPSNQNAIGHYRIVKELGRGGQGVVYLAEDTRLHRKVALKVLTGLGPGSEDSVHRLRREAEVASKLEHPGICGVHDAGVANGTPYIAMHYVDGTTLAERNSEMKSTASSTTKQQVPDILRVFEKAAQALHAAHEAGIIHRDIKPGNVMVSASGQPVILDFGMARAEDLEFQTLTRTGDVFGTPAYMSPEQISGQRIRIDRRSDVYSLGVTLYECLTLRRPFEAPTREGVYQAVMTKNPPDPRKLNPAISKDIKVIIETALEKDRDRRYATADALAKDLQAVLEGRPIHARPVGPVGRFVRWSKREPAKAALLGVILVAFPTIATLVTSHMKDRPQVDAARLARIEHDKDEILSEASYEVTEGDAEKAAALYTQVLEMEGTSPEAAGGLVLASLKLGNPGGALRLLDRQQALLGDGAAAHLLRADALWALGRKDEARALVTSAPAPKSAFEHQLLAEKELQNCGTATKPTFERALRQVTSAILLSPAPRLSLYTLRAHAAGHAKDRDAVVETAAGLQNRWPNSAPALYWSAFALSNLNDQALRDDAIAAYREAIRLKPDHTEAIRNLGGALYDKGLYDEAIALFRELIRLRPRYGQAYAQLGGALAEKGLIDDAIAACREAVRLKPTDALIQYALGEGILRKLAVDAPVASIRKEARLVLGESRSHANLGDDLPTKGLLDEAIGAFSAAARLKPDDATNHNRLGNCLLTKGLIDEAIEAHRKAVRLKPADAGVHAALGAALIRKGLLDEAIAAYREALRLDPKVPEANVTLSGALLQKGLIDEAIAASRLAIQLNPDQASAHSNLSAGLLQKGLIDEAIAASRAAIRLKPNDAANHVNFASALARKGLLDDAIAEYREAIRLEPELATAHQSLGLALSQRGLINDAIVAYREAIRLNPDIADVHRRLAALLFNEQRFEEAIAACRGAIRLKPEVAETHCNLGKALMFRYLPDDAATAFREAIRLRPDFAEAHCMLGIALSSLGRHREALAEFRLGHELGPQQPRWDIASQEWVANAEERVEQEDELEAQVAGHLAAHTTPESASELVALGRVALNQGHSATAARWFEIAFQKSQDFVDAIDAGHRRLAARAAVLTSIGGTDSAPALDAAARTTWRLQGLSWLEAEVAGIKEAHKANRIKGQLVRMALAPLTRTPEFASVRGADAIAKLPGAEQARWTKLWADIDALLSSLDRKPESRAPETRR